MFNRRINEIGATKILSKQENFTGIDIQTMRIDGGARLVFYLDITSLDDDLTFSINMAANEDQEFLEIHNSVYNAPTQVRIPVADLQRLISITISATNATYSISVTGADNSTSEEAEETLSDISNTLDNLNTFTQARYELFFPLLANANWMKLGDFDNITPSFGVNQATLQYNQNNAILGRAIIDFTSVNDWEINLERYLNDDDGAILQDDDDSSLNLD